MSPLDYTCTHEFENGIRKGQLCNAGAGQGCNSTEGGKIEGFHAERIFACDAHLADGTNVPPESKEKFLKAIGEVDLGVD